MTPGRVTCIALDPTAPAARDTDEFPGHISGSADGEIDAVSLIYRGDEGRKRARVVSRLEADGIALEIWFSAAVARIDRDPEIRAVSAGKGEISLERRMTGGLMIDSQLHECLFAVDPEGAWVASAMAAPFIVTVTAFGWQLSEIRLQMTHRERSLWPRFNG